MRSLHLVILVFKGCPEFLWGGVTLRCRLLVVVRSLRLVILVFEGCPEFLWGGVTLHCRLLVIVQSLHLVVLVFTPPCLDCCCFSYLKSCWLFTTICTASCYGFLGCKLQCYGYIIKREGEKKFWYFPTVWWSLFCLVFCAFVAEKRIVLSWIILEQNCKNLVD